MPPAVKLKATVVPLSIVRLTILGDVLKNFGATDEQIRIAQQGFAEGLFNRVTVDGLDSRGYIQDKVTLWFDAVLADTNLAVDTSSGCTMVEAASLKLARGLAYSVECMRRKGLETRFSYGFTSAAWNDEATRQTAAARFGFSELLPADSGFEPGYAPRELFRICPGMDKGTHYAHSVARKIL